MIRGAVNADYEAVLRLRLRGLGGTQRDVECVVDTGFNGFLTLPPGLIRDLGLRRIARGRAILAHGAEEVFDICGVHVLWDGQPRWVEVSALNNDPLVGMRMLEGHDLLIQVEEGGSVVVERREGSKVH